jgi:hypothetical protein
VGLNLNLALSGSAGGFAGSLIASVKNGKVQLNAQAILGRMTGGNSPLASAFRTVSDGVRSAMAIPGQLLNQVSATISGTISAVSAAAMDDVRGIASVVNAASNGTYGITITDNGAMAGMVASVSIQGAGLGLPKIFSTLAATIQNPQVLVAAARDVAMHAVSVGNMTLLADVAGVRISGNLSAVYPSVVRDACRTARPVPGTSRSTYPSAFASLKLNFSSLDPAWNTTPRAGTVVSNPGIVVNSQNPYLRDMVQSSAYSEGNQPMAYALANGTSAQDNLTDDKICYAAIAAGPTSVGSSLARNYPQVPARINARTTAQDYSRPYRGYAEQGVVVPSASQGQNGLNDSNSIIVDGVRTPANFSVPPPPPPAPPPLDVDEFGYTKAQRDAIGNTMVLGDNGKMVRFADAPSVINNYNVPAGSGFSAKSLSFD